MTIYNQLKMKTNSIANCLNPSGKLISPVFSIHSDIKTKVPTNRILKITGDIINILLVLKDMIFFINLIKFRCIELIYFQQYFPNLLQNTHP